MLIGVDDDEVLLFCHAQVMTTATKRPAKKPKVANTKKVQLPRLPDNIWRKIYASANWPSRLSLRGATKAVHQLPAPQPTVAFVRRRIAQLIKKLLNKLYSIDGWSGMIAGMIRHNSARLYVILAYYPSNPAAAAQEVQEAWARYKLGNDPTLQRLSDENANMSNAERIDKLKPYILKVVRVMSEEYDKQYRPILRKAMDNGLAQKRANARVSRRAQEQRKDDKGERHIFWKYRDPDHHELTANQLNERLRIQRNARRTARIQRRDQRRQERGDPEWLPPNNTNNSTWTPTASPPPWFTLKSTGRTRSLGNLVRASVAHPAVAHWKLRRHT